MLRFDAKAPFLFSFHRIKFLTGGFFGILWVVSVCTSYKCAAINYTDAKVLYISL
jgi:hypothetical protein